MVIKDELVNKENINLFILDIDGTLVKFTNLEALMTNVLRDMNIQEEDDSFKKYVIAVSKILKDSETNLNFDFKTLCHYINKQKVLSKKRKTPEFLKRMIDSEVDYVECIDGAQTLLENLHLQGSIVCSTNWFKKSQEAKLKKFNLDKYVSNIYTCEGNIAKPSIHHFMHILNNEFTSPKEAIMIGDSITDLPSKELGLQSILYDPNEEKEKLYDNATCVITDLSDINKIFKIKEKRKN